MQQVWRRPSISCKGGSPAQPWLFFGTVEHGCEYGETLFLSELQGLCQTPHPWPDTAPGTPSPSEQGAMAAWKSKTILSGRRHQMPCPSMSNGMENPFLEHSHPRYL